MRSLIVAWLAPWVGHDAALLLAPTYFTMVAIAGLLGTAFLVRCARRDGDHVPSVLGALMVGYAAAVAGGILLPMLVDAGAQALAGRVPRLRWAGMVAYGGLLGALVAVVWYLRRTPWLELGRLGDLLAPVLGLSVAVVRLGCFVAGCDYGQVSSLPWAVRFPAGSPAWRDHVEAGLVPAWREASLPVHPTQLYESLLGVALFVGFALALRSRRVRKGAAAGLLLPLAFGAYAVGRAGIETLRGDASRGFVGPLSTSQAIGVVVLVGVGAAVWRRVRAARAARLARLAPVAAALVVMAVALPAEAREWQGGVMVGTSNAINRRQSQVPQLVGGALVFQLDAGKEATLGAQIEIVGSSVATHSSAVLELVARHPSSRRIDLGLRVGLGATNIHFLDVSFQDLAALDFRLIGTVDLRVSPSWTLSVWPAAFELVVARDLGGPIIAYQFRVGLSYTFGVPERPAPHPALPTLP
jgi:prolipoprotein diacylglyceryltransferase